MAKLVRIVSYEGITHVEVDGVHIGKFIEGVEFSTKVMSWVNKPHDRQSVLRLHGDITRSFADPMSESFDEVEKFVVNQFKAGDDIKDSRILVEQVSEIGL